MTYYGSQGFASDRPRTFMPRVVLVSQRASKAAWESTSVEKQMQKLQHTRASR